MPYQIVILAAGKGTRMRSERPKVLHEVAFHPLLHYVLAAAAPLRGQCFTVVGHGAQEVMAAFEGHCQFVLQEEQRGTGHAVQSALPALGHDDSTVLVLCGDTPLLRGESLQAFVTAHRKGKHHCTVLTTEVADPTGYGRILRDERRQVQRIIEERDASAREKTIREINSGAYCFDKAFLREAIGALRDDNQQGELYLTDTVAYGRRRGYTMAAWRLADAEEIMGVNDRQQLAAANAVLFRRKNEELMGAGVSFIAPETAFIDPLTEIGRDTVIEPNVLMRGRCRVGERGQIGPHAELRDAVLGDDVRFWQSIAVECEGGNDLNIGPFAYIRPGTRLADQVKVGDFVELKNSTIGQGTKVPHLAYIGDSDVGRNANIGCGTITCNYDGKQKHRTTIGAHTFIGSNATLVAPLTVADNAYVAAGSTITKDVPADNLAVGRGRQRNVDGWVRKFSDKEK